MSVRAGAWIVGAAAACLVAATAWAAPPDGVRAEPRPAPATLPPPANRKAADPASSRVELTPSALPPVPVPSFGAPETRPAPAAKRDLRTGAKPADLDDKDDDDPPARPGGFAPAPSKVPSPLHKNRVIAPHTTSPDLEMDLTKRSSVGVFGEVGRINREDVRTSTVREGRDLGAGVTWQYKFDSR